jgi:hypothetical protein
MTFPTPTCSICGKPLDQLGGILLSPPTAVYGHTMVEKHHVCVGCWDNRVLPLVQYEPPSP